jgi:hypothetical protein
LLSSPNLNIYIYLKKPKTATLCIQPIPANKQTTFLHSEIDVALEQQNPVQTCPKCPVDLPFPNTKTLSAFLSMWLFKKGCPQTTDCIAYRPALRLARNPRRLALALGKVISALSSYIPVFENRWLLEY